MKSQISWPSELDEIYTYEDERLDATSDDPYEHDLTAIVILDVRDKSRIIYLGHVYAWTTDETCNMIGIRSSLSNLALRICKRNIDHVANKLLQGIQLWCKLHCQDLWNGIHVSKPIGLMPYILSKAGFRIAADPPLKRQPSEAELFESLRFSGQCDVHL